MTVDFAQAVKYATFAKQIYQSFDGAVFDGVVNPTLISDAKTDTQCAILPSSGAPESQSASVTIVFRGSDSSVDWDTNFDTKPERADFDKQVIREEIVNQRTLIYPYSDKSESGAMMHSGFITAYFSVRDQIQDHIKAKQITHVAVTGHSLGGALATLCAVDLQFNCADLAIEAYTFGSPKVGNRGFEESFNRRVPNSYRFVAGMDIVPELPRWWQGWYAHVNTEIRLKPRFSWHILSAPFMDHALDKYIAGIKKLAGQA
jgi:triacylglycerol lipase